VDTATERGRLARLQVGEVVVKRKRPLFGDNVECVPATIARRIAARCASVFLLSQIARTTAFSDTLRHTAASEGVRGRSQKRWV